MVGLSMARSTRSGTLVGPGICRKCRPARCVIWALLGNQSPMVTQHERAFNRVLYAKEDRNLSLCLYEYITLFLLVFLSLMFGHGPRIMHTNLFSVSAQDGIYPHSHRNCTGGHCAGRASPAARGS